MTTTNTSIMKNNPETWKELLSSSKDAKGLDALHPEVVKLLNAPSKDQLSKDEQEKMMNSITNLSLNAIMFRSHMDEMTILHHIADLCNAAYFFACRSCEYSLTTGTRRTKIITIKNVVFRQGNRIIHHRRLFHKASSVSITFIKQKNDNHFETVTQHNNNHPTQNHVKLFARIVNRILDSPGTNLDTTINAFWNENTNRIEYIKSKQILESLRWACEELGPDRLGYTHDEIGCHSIRSGAAIAMYLMGIKPFTIMLQGRWCSDAFLRYIRKQVKEFSKGVSSAMVSSEVYAFYTVPDCMVRFGDEDPRTPNNPQSLTSSFNGSSALSAFTRHHIYD